LLEDSHVEGLSIRQPNPPRQKFLTQIILSYKIRALFSKNKGKEARMKMTTIISSHKISVLSAPPAGGF
jgi:hypothetical protein